MKRFILVLGILLVILGVAGLVHPRLKYNTTEEVAKLGPVQATVTHDKIVEVPLAVSILVLAAGVGLAIIGSRSSK